MTIWLIYIEQITNSAQTSNTQSYNYTNVIYQPNCRLMNKNPIELLWVNLLEISAKTCVSIITLQNVYRTWIGPSDSTAMSWKRNLVPRSLFLLLFWPSVGVTEGEKKIIVNVKNVKTLMVNIRALLLSYVRRWSFSADISLIQHYNAVLLHQGLVLLLHQGLVQQNGVVILDQNWHPLKKIITRHSWNLLS